MVPRRVGETKGEVASDSVDEGAEETSRISVGLACDDCEVVEVEGELRRAERRGRGSVGGESSVAQGEMSEI